MRQVNLPFAFPYFGGSYTQFWVDINGKIRFDSSSGDYAESSNTLVAAKMIAVLWDDLHTGGGNVFTETNATEVSVRWAGAYYGGPAVHFSLTLRSDGIIRMRYGPGNASGGMIGISGGTGTNYLFSARSQAGSQSNAQDIVMMPYSPNALPPGLALATDGAISGTPLRDGSYNVPFTVADSWGATTQRWIALLITPATVADTDGDSLPDWWELQWFGGATNATATADGDNDRCSNWHEYVAGTDPSTNASFLGISSIQMQPAAAGMVVRWLSVTNRWYNVERAVSLTITNAFTNIAQHVAGQASLTSITDATPVVSQPRIYRIGVE